MIYPEISAKLGNPSAFELARLLGKMALDGKINYSSPGSSFVTQWPVYHIGKLPKGFKYPTRPGK